MMLEQATEAERDREVEHSETTTQLKNQIEEQQKDINALKAKVDELEQQLQTGAGDQVNPNDVDVEVKEGDSSSDDDNDPIPV